MVIRTGKKVVSILLMVVMSGVLSGCFVRPIKEYYSADEIKRALMSNNRADLMIYFQVDSADVSNRSQKQIQSLGEAINTLPLPRYQVKLVGHTDSSGEQAYNVHLSLQRAKAVERVLNKRFNVAKKHMLTEGRGESDPYVSPERNDLDRKYNRRVSLELIRK